MNVKLSLCLSAKPHSR